MSASIKRIGGKTVGGWQNKWGAGSVPSTTFIPHLSLQGAGAKSCSCRPISQHEVHLGHLTSQVMQESRCAELPGEALGVFCAHLTATLGVSEQGVVCSSKASRSQADNIT